MIRYNIHVNSGNENKTISYYFVHKDWATISEEDSNKEFDKAVQELNRIYQNYGRFATEIGVVKLFESFGFIRTMKD